jgi:hypothetical protein
VDGRNGKMMMWNIATVISVVITMWNIATFISVVITLLFKKKKKKLVKRIFVKSCGCTAVG